MNTSIRLNLLSVGKQDPIGSEPLQTTCPAGREHAAI